MVQGMAFLSKKGFNPQNNANRKQVWEAQQHSKLEKERLRKRQEQLQREKEDAELELATRGEIGGSQAQLRFMYDAPPGLQKKNDDTGDGKMNPNKHNRGDDDTPNDLSKVKPGDDAAAIAFRQMLASAAASSGDNNKSDDPSGNEDQGDAKAFKFTPSLQGSMVEADSRYNKNDDNNDGNSKPPPMQDSRSALEKEVGRKNRSTQNNLSYEQQIERFPQLKNAPMAVKRGGTSGNADGNNHSNMMVNFKPLGSQILHVRCMACGIWGHSRGDRECKKSGWNPFAMPSQSQTGNCKTSSIMPPSRDEGKERSSKPRETSSDDRRKRKKHRKERYDSDSEDSRRRKYSSSSRYRRRRENDFNDYDSEDSYSSQGSRDRRKHRRRRRYKEQYSNSSDDESSNSDPSSENSSKLKRRNDDRYDSSEDERRRHRKKRRKSSKKGSKRHESSSSHKKKKKKRRHSSP